MVSTIREATEEEKGLARKFAQEFSDKSPIKNVVVLAEEKYGLKVIYKNGNPRELPVLMPSGKILVWDFDVRSLDELGPFDFDSEEANAITYTGLVAEPYLKLQGVKIPEYYDGKLSSWKNFDI